MRQISIAAIITAVVVALFGASAMIVNGPHKAVAAAVSSSIDITQMTIDAKRLPVEQFDAI